ncbi:hypothetical protein F4677DRAFT_420290 [Hypoxylon crocopeplum]|nr:hypothetical protein F4677DRAFT_420290 [Hypoxylon crocopeplum]
MTRERKKAPAPTRGVRALTRRAKLERAPQQQQQSDWRALNPLKTPPKVKHKTTFELVENVNKKKKLEFKITTDRHPPPGFEFVPIGHPTLSQLCKDLSREQDAMIFIVSGAKNPDLLDHHVNRVGYHFRQVIVEQAGMKLREAGKYIHLPRAYRPGQPEPIPKNQEEIDAQADAVLKDLFPRIPHTDRREIIRHAFEKDGKFNGESKVGMAQDLTLARRVQLAAIAHIRHTLTRYDELLKQSNWTNARKAVEKPCLDIIVKWRGDEETGRDQLDEILREVIEISDTEEESDDETPNGDAVPARRVSTMPTAALLSRAAEPLHMTPADQLPASQAQRRDLSVPSVLTPSRQKAIAKAEKKSARKTQRFRRYAAAAQALSGSSDQRSHIRDSNVAPFDSATADLTKSPGSVRLVDSSREATVPARGTPNLEQMPPRFVELRSGPHRFNGDLQQGRMAGVRYSTNEYGSPQPMRNSEGYRPKVGHPLANYSQPQVPLSPVRNGLQDMLLQSIEPASPVGPRELRSASRTLHSEPRHLPEAHRALPGTYYEPVGSVAHPRSPRIVHSGNELVAQRRRAAGYPPDRIDAHTGSYFQVNRQDRGEDLRRIPDEHLSSRTVLPMISADRVLSQNQPWRESGEGAAHYNDVPYRTRAHPIVIDDSPHRPGQVVEVQRHPGGLYQVPSSLRQGEPGRDVPVRGSARIQGDSGFVIINEPPARSRSTFGHYSGPVDPHTHGLPLYQESNHRLPATESSHRVVYDPPPAYEPGRHREPLRSHHLVPEPVDWPGHVRQETQGVPQGSDCPGVRYADAQHGFHERSNFAPISNLPPDQRESYRYRLEQPIEALPQQMEYLHDPQPLVAPSTHGHYVEGHRVPFQHHAPEQRSIVWVDR